MGVSFGIGKYRMEALVDGVSAIAMTLIVLEVRVPDLGNPGESSALLIALGRYGLACWLTSSALDCWASYGCGITDYLAKRGRSTASQYKYPATPSRYIRRVGVQKPGDHSGDPLDQEACALRQQAPARDVRRFRQMAAGRPRPPPRRRSSFSHPNRVFRCHVAPEAMRPEVQLCEHA